MGDAWQPDGIRLVLTWGAPLDWFPGSWERTLVSIASPSRFLNTGGKIKTSARGEKWDNVRFMLHSVPYTSLH